MRRTKSLLLLTLLCAVVQGAWAQTGNVTMAAGTEDAANWAITPNTDVAAGNEVTVSYNGNLNVTSLTGMETYLENLLINGSFDANNNGWFGWGATQSWDATGGIDGSGAVKIEVTTASNIWDAVWAQDLSAALAAGKTYMLRYKIRCSGTGHVRGLVQHTTDPYPSVGNLTTQVGTVWTTVEMPFTVTDDGYSYIRLCFQTGADANVTYWIDDVVLGEMKQRTVEVTEAEAGRQWTFTMPENSMALQVEYATAYRISFSGTHFDASEWVLTDANGHSIPIGGLATPGSQVTVINNGNRTLNSITAVEEFIDNQLSNGSFDANNNGWFGWGATQSWDATGGTDGSGAVKIEVTTASNIWDAVWAQDLSAALAAGKTYMLRYKIRCSGTGHVRGLVQHTTDPYPSVGNLTTQVGTVWTTVEMPFTVTDDGYSYIRLCFQTGADANVTYWIDDVVLGEVNQQALEMTEAEAGRQWTFTMPENSTAFQVECENGYIATFMAANAYTIETGASTITVDGKTAIFVDGKTAPISNGQTVTLIAQDGFEFQNVAVTEVSYPLLSAATTADCGKVVCAAGHLHTAKTAVPVGCTAVGILAKVTQNGHGLILALHNAPMQTLNTIDSWQSVTNYANTTLKLLPDTNARGNNLTSYTTLGSTAVSNWAVAQKSDYVAIFTNLGSTVSDDDGVTFDANVNAYITTGVGGSAINGTYWSATQAAISAGWGYENRYWATGYKTFILNIRPVLGF